MSAQRFGSVIVILAMLALVGAAIWGLANADFNTKVAVEYPEYDCPDCNCPGWKGPEITLSDVYPSEECECDWVELEQKITVLSPRTILDDLEVLSIYKNPKNYPVVISGLQAWISGEDPHISRTYVQFWKYKYSCGEITNKERVYEKSTLETDYHLGFTTSSRKDLGISVTFWEYKYSEIPGLRWETLCPEDNGNISWDDDKRLPLRDDYLAPKGEISIGSDLILPPNWEMWWEQDMGNITDLNLVEEAKWRRQ